MNKTILVPLSSIDFDPSEVAIPWKILTQRQFKVVFSTVDGRVAECDPRMITGNGLGPFAGLLRADKNSRDNYQEVANSAEFRKPILWSEIDVKNFDGLLLHGGHAKGMRPYLESPVLQKVVADFFAVNKPVGAICHGVLLAARSRGVDGKSVLFKKNVTCLLERQEKLAWQLTRWWRGDYYLTYDITTQAEVTSFLENPVQFHTGPAPIFRDSITNLKPGFFVRDGQFISARWPGDAHGYTLEFINMLSVSK